MTIIIKKDVDVKTIRVRFCLKKQQQTKTLLTRYVQQRHQLSCLSTEVNTNR